MNYNPFQSYGIYDTAIYTHRTFNENCQICVLYTTSELYLKALIILAQEYNFWKVDRWIRFLNGNYRLVLRREL